MDVIRIGNPAPPLREFVRFYAHREVRTGKTSVIHPVPARAFPVLEFVLGDQFQVIYRDGSPAETSPRTVLIGPVTHCHSRLQFQGVVDCFVVVFQPAGLYRLFSLPVRELTDHAYDAHSVLGTFVSSLQQVLGECGSFSERVHAADAYLLRTARTPRCGERISAAATRVLAASGHTRVTSLAAHCGLSVRQFEREFQKQLGLSPKLFARIVRFEAALDRKARASTNSWLQVAHELGYFDQMHMIHDFAEFTGGTPTQMLMEVEGLFRERINAIRAGLCPTPTSKDLELVL
jgi:AraC-like DNA-binding protein